MQKLNYFRTLFWVLSLLIISNILYAYPSSVNSVPTAQVLNAGEVLLEQGNAGYPSLFNDESSYCSSVTAGFGSSFEFGADRYSNDSCNQTCINCKYRIFSEQKNAFDFAFGVMDVSKDSKTTYYAAASKTFNNIRAHLGYITEPYTHGIMAGADMEIGSDWWLGADYIPGDFNYFSVAVSRNLSANSYITFCYGFPNNSDISNSEVSITIGTLINTSNS